jgi:hypothetical protein
MNINEANSKDAGLDSKQASPTYKSWKVLRLESTFRRNIIQCKLKSDIRHCDAADRQTVTHSATDSSTFQLRYASQVSMHVPSSVWHTATVITVASRRI